MRKHPSEHSEAECHEASFIFSCRYVCPFMEIYIYADMPINEYFHFRMKMKNLDLGNPRAPRIFIKTKIHILARKTVSG